MNKLPSTKTIHNDYFEDLNDFLNRKHKIIKNNGSCMSTPPSVLSVNNTRRIVAIGDIHGDFNALLIALYKAKVIDLKGHWNGGDTKVIQVGDLLDKGGRGVPEDEGKDCKDDSEWRIILFLEYLNKEAKKDDGAVFILIGNHEIMNFRGDMRYTTSATMAYFGGLKNRTEIFKRGGIISQKIACMTNTIMRLGDWVFVHAGITADIMKHYDSLEDINDDVRNFILNKLDIDETANKKSREYKLHKLIGSSDGVIWTRLYGSDVDNDTCKSLNKTLDLITGESGGGLVVGHTVQEDISGNCNGRLFQIDRGMSSGFGLKDKIDERIDILEIINGVPSPYKMNIDDVKVELNKRGLTDKGKDTELKSLLDEHLKNNYIFIFGKLLDIVKNLLNRKLDLVDSTLLKKSGFAQKNDNLILDPSTRDNLEGYILQITTDELKLLDNKLKYLRIPLNWNMIKTDEDIPKYSISAYFKCN